MEYSIQELSRMAGISTRTLRYYDETGLLKPARVTQAGYRYYGTPEVDRLQQILYYRERGFQLHTIQKILQRHLRNLQRIYRLWSSKSIRADWGPAGKTCRPLNQHHHNRNRCRSIQIRRRSHGNSGIRPSKSPACKNYRTGKGRSKGNGSCKSRACKTKSRTGSCPGTGRDRPPGSANPLHADL